MIKVLFMIPNLGHGGAEKVLVNLVNHMDLSKYQITVLSLYNEGVNRQFLTKDIKYRYCFSRAIPGAGHILKVFSPSFLFRFCVKEKYDIVVSYLEGQTARIISGCKDNNVRKVCWIHRTITDINDASRMFRNSKEAIKSYASFDRIVSVSEDVQNCFMSLFRLDDKGSVLYNTNQSEYIKQMEMEVIDDIDFNANIINLCAMGTLIPVKGFDRLLKVQKRLCEDGIDVHLYILGEGPDKKKLENLVEELSIQETVTFLGYKKNPYKYLGKCDLFVCSSISEGFSTAVTEALILGIPVITTRVSGMQELLGKNQYGVITDNDEMSLYLGIKELVSSKDILSRYKQLAEIRGKCFNTVETVSAVQNFFDDLVRES